MLSSHLLHCKKVLGVLVRAKTNPELVKAILFSLVRPLLRQHRHSLLPVKGFYCTGI